MINSIETTILFEDDKKSFIKCRDLKQINVITGENRVGKSSFLSCFPAVLSYLNDLTYPDTKKKNYATPFFIQNMYIPNVKSFSIEMDLDDGNEYRALVDNVQRKKDTFYIDSYNRNIISGIYDKSLYAARDIHTYLYHYDIALVDSVDEHLSPSKQADLARLLTTLVKNEPNSQLFIISNSYCFLKSLYISSIEKKVDTTVIEMLDDRPAIQYDLKQEFDRLPCVKTQVKLYDQELDL